MAPGSRPAPRSHLAVSVLHCIWYTHSVVHDVLDRLYRTKMVLSCLILVATGIILIVVGNHLSHGEGWSWLKPLPWSEFGGILIGAGVLSVWLDHFFAREQQAIDEQRLRHLLHEQAPAMRDAVLEAFAANQSDLARVATPETLDQIITKVLPCAWMIRSSPARSIPIFATRRSGPASAGTTPTCPSNSHRSRPRPPHRASMPPYPTGRGISPSPSVGSTRPSPASRNVVSFACPIARSIPKSPVRVVRLRPGTSGPTTASTPAHLKPSSYCASPSTANPGQSDGPAGRTVRSTAPTSAPSTSRPANR